MIKLNCMVCNKKITTNNPGTIWLERPTVGEDKWHVEHSKCDTEQEDGEAYWFRASRFETAEEIDGWEEHLKSKRWFDWPTWDELLRYVGRI